MTFEHEHYPHDDPSLSLEIRHGGKLPTAGRKDTEITVWRYGKCRHCGKRNAYEFMTLTFPPIAFEISANAPNLPSQIVRGISELAGILGRDIAEGKFAIHYGAVGQEAGQMEITSV